MEYIQAEPGKYLETVEAMVKSGKLAVVVRGEYDYSQVMGDDAYPITLAEHLSGLRPTCPQG